MFGKSSKVSRALNLVVACLVLLVFVERPLQAYADPGTGLLMWQLLGAVVVGAVFQVRRGVKRLQSLPIFSKRNQSTAPTNDHMPTAARSATVL